MSDDVNIEPQGRVLIVAGSDSSSGAGIQADLKTVHQFGAYGMTAITAITAQNTTGVQRVEALEPSLVADQMHSCLDDIGADVIKIGMLANAKIIEAVSEVIADKAEECFVVLDPVMVATSGDRLMDEDALEAMKTLMIRADLVTPNMPEAALLSGLSVEDTEELQIAGEALLKAGAGAALMKGGHLEGSTIYDLLVTRSGTDFMSAPRIHSRHTHGTGCTLASAVAAGISLGLPLRQAVSTAREYLHEAIKTAPKLGCGHGPVNHGAAVPGASKFANDVS